jgi:hypothetical protein
MLVAYNKQQWRDEIPDLTKPIKDASGKQKTDPQTGRPLYELVQEGTRITSARLNHIEDGIETVNELADQNTADIDTHKKDAVKHITAAERAEWKAKETPAGAQTKADAALSSAKTYADTALLAKADKSSTYSKTETDQRIQAVVGAAPDALDTLKEIGDALNNDPNFAATVTNQLSGKVDKVSGKQLSTEDYSSAEKAKLAGLTPGAGAAGSATDATIGTRTADPSIATPYSLTGTITQWFSWITKYFKAITGKANPFDTPDITLAATKTHVDDTTRHITAAERTAWNAAESNAKNASIPKTEKGVAGGVAALDATKLMLSDGTILGSRVVERVFNFSFANGVANQKIDVIFPVNGGLYEIEVIGSFNTVNTAGKLVKRFNGTYSNPASYPTGSQYTGVTGVLKNHISIGEPFFDSDLKWRVPLESRTTAPNPFTVIVRVLSGGGAATAPTLSAVYTGTAATTLPVAVQAIPDDTITQSGYLIQKHKLTENDGSATTVITGSVDTLVTSGWYTVQSTSVTGLPLTGTTGMLEVVGYMQRFTETPSMRSWKRRLNAGTWNAWVEDENASRKNVSNGYAGLDANALVPDARISGNISRISQQVPANTDLNEFRNEGDYFCPSNATAATILNMPTSIAGQSFYLRNNRHAGANQNIVSYNSTSFKIYTRNFYSSATPQWSPWQEIETSASKNVANGYAGLDALIKVPRVNTYNSLSGTTTTVSDLNTLYTAGTYAVSSTAVGIPNGGEYGQVLVHVSNSETHDGTSNWIWQMFYGTAGSTFVRRKVNNGGWASWVPMWTGYNDGPLFVTRTMIANSTDLNTVIVNGVYSIYQPTGLSNMPPVGISYGVLSVSKADSSTYYVKQEIMDVLTGTVWTRIRSSAVWTAWTSNITSGGGTMVAALTRNYDSSFYSYRNLVGYSATGTATGTIKITLPKGWSSTMMTIKIKGFDYGQGKGAWELTLGGYNYATTPAWVNVSALLSGRVPFDRIRLAHDGTNNCILLGSLTTVWGITHIEVSEFTASFGAITGWEKGWQMALITSETGIFNAVQPPLSPQYGKSSTTNYFMMTTSEFAFLTRTPVESGNFEARVYLRLTTAASVKVTATYKDHASTAQSTVIVDDVFPIGSFSLPVAFFAATSEGPISLSIKCSVANAVYASGSIIDC